MSAVSPQPFVCPYCEQEVCVLDQWRFDCGRVKCCSDFVQHVGEYHRSGECDLDRALDRALARDEGRQRASRT